MQNKHQNYNLFRRHDKVDWLVDVNYSSNFTSKIELSFPPNATNIILSENLSHLDKIILNENSKIELKWWVQNLEIWNGRALIQPSREVLIQADASIGATRNGISTEGGCGMPSKWKIT